MRGTLPEKASGSEGNGVGELTAAKSAPVPVEPDWYAIPKERIVDLQGAPGHRSLKKRPGVVLIHRSHLPLLGEDVSVAKPVDCGQPIPGVTLRDYQKVGASFLRTGRGLILGDQMRLGKTAQVVASHDPAAGPLVVVGPLSTRLVWLDWMAKRWPDVTPFVATGRRFDSDLRLPPLAFCHYDVLTAWSSMGFAGPGWGTRRIGTLVFDEAHLLSNRKAKRSKSAAYLASQAERVILVTGTLLWNSPSGLYTLLQIATPGAWGSWVEFCKRYCDGKMGAYGWVASGTSNEEEFQARMETIYLRREWADVAQDLPQVSRTQELAPITTREESEITKAVRLLAAQASRTSVMTELAHLRRLLGLVKAPTAIRIANDVLQGGPSEKVVVWTWHKHVAQIIAEGLWGHGHNCWMVTGHSTEEAREKYLREWRSAESGALCITMGVGQVGIDLSAAKHAIFAELDYTPATVAQAEMRTFSPERPMSVTYVVADHPVDHALGDALSAKIEKAQALGVTAADVDLGSIFDLHCEADVNRILEAIHEG